MNVQAFQVHHPGSTSIPPYYIPATESLQEQRPRTLKHGDTFAVFDHNGDLVFREASPEGLYHRDTRHLSHLSLTLRDIRPMLLSSTVREDNAALTCDLTNPDLFEDGQLVLERDLIHIRRSKFLWNAACFERLAVRSFSRKAQEITVEIRFAADFADLFEVRGSRRDKRGTLHAPEIGQDSVLLSYTGLDDRRRTTLLRFDPASELLEPHRAVFRLKLAPRGCAVIFVEVHCDGEVPNMPPRQLFRSSIRDARRALKVSSARAASVHTSNEIFNEMVKRSVSDLYMLMTDKPQGPYPYAGIPWYSAAFGRDALITAYQMLWADPEIARGVLGYLAANQALDHDPASDAEPGKILHEVRHGEMAELGEIPFRRYYGSVDSTPLFVMLAGAYLERTGDIETIRHLWPRIEAALDWIDQFADRDGDGLVEYGRASSDGLANQGWKDSEDSVFHSNGELAEGPIAICEVQGYVYAARRAAASIAKALGHVDRAAALEKQSSDLQNRVESAFWCEQLGTYALALDGQKQPCTVRSSNAGHMLFAGIAAPKHAGRVAEGLMDSSFFSGWGIRTIASTEALYNPMSYHNGSVWPHDNALIALGLARYGFKPYAARIFERLFESCMYDDLRRLPELFCGFPRRRGEGPTFYPVACAPQAWAAAAPLALLQACLGLSFDSVGRRVRFDRPILPAFLDEVVLRGLSIGDARIDVALRRADGDVAMNVLSREGDIQATLTS